MDVEQPKNNLDISRLDSFVEQMNAINTTLASAEHYMVFAVIDGKERLFFSSQSSLGTMSMMSSVMIQDILTAHMTRGSLSIGKHDAEHDVHGTEEEESGEQEDAY